MDSSQILADLHQNLLRSYSQIGAINHLEGSNLPSRRNIIEIVRIFEEVLFPGFFENAAATEHDLRLLTARRLADLYHRLENEIRKNLLFEGKRHHSSSSVSAEEVTEITGLVLNFLPHIRDQLKLDLNSLFEGDPAAKEKEEVILSYPGLRAIAVYRISHLFWQKGLRLISRMMSEYIHSRTGIDIHPGAEIGEHFFIDHGTGIVIGETTRIGNHVKIYQGVTLGALSVNKKLGDQKRHPTIEDHVTIYANATILGGETVIGAHSVIGGNVWLTHSVPSRSLVLNSPQVSILDQNKDITLDYSI